MNPFFMHRRKPFSAKQKKIQLQEKRKRKKKRNEQGSDSDGDNEDQAKEKPGDSKSSNKASSALSDRRQNPNRYRLLFFKETNVEIQRRKNLAKKQILVCKEEVELEVNIDDIYHPGSLLDVPKRPPWSYYMSKKEVDEEEEKYFENYVNQIVEKYTPSELSFFEMNLETWRQFWRVLEMSDVMLLIVDIRYVVLHFSPTLYTYVTQELRKPLIVVLNKIDLAPPGLTVALKHYLLQKYPELQIVVFTSYPKEVLQDNDYHQANKATRRRSKGGRFVTASGARDLLKVCQDIVQDRVDLSSWEEKINMEDMLPPSEEEEERGGDTQSGPDTRPQEHEIFKDGILTIGCLGYPNAGKSSLLNGLVGKKVVSVSKTPGHTKHFQTIFLTPTVKLCDCPGLVFPSLVDRNLQILAGIYPIAQVRDPFTPLGFLSERINIPKILNLRLPDVKNDRWTVYDMCEAWAIRRGFLTAKASRPDVYRAANNLLRFNLDGRLRLCLRPTGYTKDKEKWSTHQETRKLLTDLEVFKPKDDCDLSGGSEEDTDEELEEAEVLHKGDNSSSDSSSGIDECSGGITTSNPFDLLNKD